MCLIPERRARKVLGGKKAKSKILFGSGSAKSTADWHLKQHSDHDGGTTIKAVE